MKNILSEIIAYKKQYVAKQKELYPVKLLEQSIHFETPCVSLREYILRPDKNGIIAEYKKEAPSSGLLHPHANVEDISIGYMQAGASALSILTDQKFFGGKNEDLSVARNYNFCPILRKDFIIDEYQIIEAKSIGADAILLIAEALEAEEVKRLANFANSLGLEVLFEIHEKAQLAKLNSALSIVGVNNRNLKTLEVDIAQSIQIAHEIPQEFVKISESGIRQASDLIRLQKVGYQGFLIGSQFMSSPDPIKACSKFIQEVNELEKAHVYELN